MPAPTDPALYKEAKEFIEKKYKTNSPFRSGAIVKQYKQQFKKKNESGNPYTNEGPKNLERFFEEKWVAVNPVIGESGKPVFRPTKRVSDKTPRLLQDTPSNILRKQVSHKQKIPMTKRLARYATVIHHAKTGGALSIGSLKNLLNASYDKKTKETDGFIQDRDLSTKTSKVYVNPDTGQTVVAHKGTTGFTDWANNAMYALGGETLYKTTDRYKEAKAVQRGAEKKYGRDNISTIGHSQGGLQAELLGKKGNETITLNKATRPFSNTQASNQYDVRTKNDAVSALNPFQSYKPDLTVDAETYNPLTAHSVDTLNKVDQNQMIGRGFNPFISRGKIGGMIVRRFDY
jgi:hypothetical protein